MFVNLTPDLLMQLMYPYMYGITIVMSFFLYSQMTHYCEVTSESATETFLKKIMKILKCLFQKSHQILKNCLHYPNSSWCVKTTCSDADVTTTIRIFESPHV